MENEHIVGKFDDDLDRIKNEILEREKRIRSKGTKFIFPLPNIEVR